MKRNTFEQSLPVYDRIRNIEKTIQELEDLRSHDGFIEEINIEYISTKIINSEVPEFTNEPYYVSLTNISRETFMQNILEYYINVLSLELKELEEEFEKL